MCRALLDARIDLELLRLDRPELAYYQTETIESDVVLIGRLHQNVSGVSICSHVYRRECHSQRIGRHFS